VPAATLGFFTDLRPSRLKVVSCSPVASGLPKVRLLIEAVHGRQDRDGEIAGRRQAKPSTQPGPTSLTTWQGPIAGRGRATKLANALLSIVSDESRDAEVLKRAALVRSAFATRAPTRRLPPASSGRNQAQQGWVSHRSGDETCPKHLTPHQRRSRTGFSP
jgi:hypothetical protein